MNKTFNINLGGYPFAIDEDAYEYVQNYLHTIRNHFSTSEGCDEILYDIEARMAELFQEHLKGRSIVSMKEVDEIVMIMGKPEDFGAEPMDEVPYTRQNQSSGNQKKSKYGNAKRLFRDADDKKVGGVCSGIAAYFGIEDPLWVRLIFVAFIFIGISPVLYFILWVLVPVANTSGDKLSMRGEPATINNIAKVIEEELNDLGHRINEWGNEINEEFGSKSKDKKKSKEMKTETQTHKFVSNGVNAIGTVVSSISYVLSNLFKGSFKVIALILAGVLILAWMASLFGISYASPTLSFAGPKSTSLGYLGILSGMFVITLPLVGLLLSFIKMVWSYRIHSNIKQGMWIVWFLSILTTSYAGMKTVKEYSIGYDTVQKEALNIQDETLILSSLPQQDHNIGVGLGNIMYKQDNLYSIESTDVKVERSPDDRIYIERHISARGENSDEARSNSLLGLNQYEVVGNKITFDPYLTLPSNAHYRGQDIDYVVYVPVGKKVMMDDKFKAVGRASDFIPWEQMYKDGVNTWTVTAGGAKSSQYEDKVNHTRVVDNINFTKLIVENGFDIEVRRGTKTSATIIGDKELVTNVELKSISGILTIVGDNSENDDMENVKLIIEIANDLEMIQLDNVFRLKMKDIKQKTLEVICTGNDWQDGEIRLEGQIENLNVSLSDHQNLLLIGSGENLNLSIQDNAAITADKYLVNNAKITGHDLDESVVHVSKLITCSDPENLDIKALGNPEIKKY